MTAHFQAPTAVLINTSMVYLVAFFITILGKRPRNRNPKKMANINASSASLGIGGLPELMLVERPCPEWTVASVNDIYPSPGR